MVDTRYSHHLLRVADPINVVIARAEFGSRSSPENGLIRYFVEKEELHLLRSKELNQAITRLAKETGTTYREMSKIIRKVIFAIVTKDVD
ncbi:hypothetical protein KW783_01140 [Candidatus Parcubacteria bacterium]|nr:hypothetical protein [Candidatus Parcubacteria bacterium]